MWLEKVLARFVTVFLSSETYTYNIIGNNGSSLVELCTLYNYQTLHYWRLMQCRFAIVNPFLSLSFQVSQLIISQRVSNPCFPRIRRPLGHAFKEFIVNVFSLEDKQLASLQVFQEKTGIIEIIINHLLKHVWTGIILHCSFKPWTPLKMWAEIRSGLNQAHKLEPVNDQLVSKGFTSKEKSSNWFIKKTWF